MRYTVGMSRSALWIGARAAMLLCMATLWYVPIPLSAQTPTEELPTEALPEEALVEVSDQADVSARADTALRRQGVTVTPVVANEKAKPRDILKKELTVSNGTDAQVSLYMVVSNIDPESGDRVAGGPTESDLSTSFANWIEITRGVIDLAPGESRKIPYLIHVNLNARPGGYFARIGLHQGGNRAMAEGGDPVAELVLNMEVIDDANERLQLGGFTTGDSIVLGDAVSFSYLLENVGNRLVEPRGSIRIFNRKGEEVGSVPLNADGEEISPENKRQLAASWAASGRFGKYKAFLNLEYGESQLASVQDTVYFWVFPWKEILTALVGVLVLGIIGTYIVHMRAMARPVPARVYAERARETYPPEPSAPYPTAPTQSTRRFEVNGPTVLASVRPTYADRPAPVTYGRTPGGPTRSGSPVRLSSRKSATATHGPVVELAPRHR